MIPYLTYLIFGPPGSGKGTQSKALCNKLPLFHLSSGEVIRQLDPNSEKGRHFFYYVNRGELPPDDQLIVDIVKDHIVQLIELKQFDPSTHVLLLDGIPRTKNQARLIEAYCNVDRIIVLQVNDNQELIKRMRNRALIEGRKDDQDEAILKKRFEVYEKQTKEVLSYYDESKLLKINGMQDPNQVTQEILNYLKK